jgi:hypothetical protein
MMGVSCAICRKTHDSPLELHLCSLQIGSRKSNGWCLWCGEPIKRAFFCKDHCRIAYLDDVHEEEITKSIRRAKAKLRRKNADRLRVPARVLP